jgi:hypothetical protein
LLDYGLPECESECECERELRFAEQYIDKTQYQITLEHEEECRHHVVTHPFAFEVSVKRESHPFNPFKSEEITSPTKEEEHKNSTK